MKTGFKELDEIINLEKNKLILLGGRPAMGKTQFTIDIINNITLKQDIPTLFFSLESSKEMIINNVTDTLYLSFIKKYKYSKEEIEDNLLALQSNIDISKIKRTKMRKQNINILGDTLTDNEQELLNKYLEQIQNSKLYIDDKPKVTLEYIEEQCRILKQTKTIRFVVIDYLQLLNYKDDIKKLGISLKTLAEELGLTILVLSQLSRNLERRTDKRPVITDLRESKAIAGVSNIILFLYRASYYDVEATDKGMEVIVAKNDGRKTGIVRIDTKENTNG